MRGSFWRWRPQLTRSLVGLVILAGRVRADELAPEAESRVRLIERAEYFAFGRVGYSGQLPLEINAIRDLLQHPQADAAFKRLVAAEALPVRLYGLSGLYFTDRAAFDKVVALMATSNAQVRTMHGCILTREDVAKIVRLPPGEGVELHPGENLADWVRGNPEKAIRLDMAGGGIPQVVRYQRWTPSDVK